MDRWARRGGDVTVMHREELTFDSHGTRCDAWLYRPQGSVPHPVVVMAHGFALTREAGLAGYAERFAAAGIAAFVLDFRHFGTSGGTPRQLLRISRQLDDYRAALTHVRGLPDLDAGRVAVWGTSFAGGHAFELARTETDLRAAVAQVPFADGLGQFADHAARDRPQARHRRTA